MVHFKDSLGRQWSLELNTLEVKRIRKELDVDLLDEERVAGLINDPVLLVDVISALLSDQIKAAAIDETSFARGLADGGLEKAIDAMVESLANFFGARGRLIAAAYRKQQATMEAVGAHAEQRIQAMDLETPLRRKLDEQIESALTKFGS